MTTTRRLHLPELAFARRQRGLVTHAQLLPLLSRSAIRHRVRTGRLHVIHPGVYAVGRPQLDREGWWLAAVLACGDGAALSHQAAGVLWGILERGDERPHVTVPTQAGRKAPTGVTLHRSATLTAADVVERHGIRVTSLLRTLIDLAGTLERRALRGALRRAEQVHRIDLRALRAAVAHPLSAPGPARLRALLDEYVPGDANPGLEDDFLALCRRYRLPIPDQQFEIGEHRADFVWHDVRLIVETDDRQTHDTHVAFVADRAKLRALAAHGYEVAPYTWLDIRRRPAAVARELRAARARRQRELGGGVA